MSGTPESLLKSTAAELMDDPQRTPILHGIWLNARAGNNELPPVIEELARRWFMVGCCHAFKFIQELPEDPKIIVGRPGLTPSQAVLVQITGEASQILAALSAAHVGEPMPPH